MVRSSSPEKLSVAGLLDGVWPDTFVEEGSLTQNIFTLRKVLGDGDHGLSFIETFQSAGTDL